MSEIDVYREIAALLHPIPPEPAGNTTARQDLEYDEYADHMAELREDTARQLRDVTADTGDDPLIVALAQEASGRDVAEVRIRRLITYARSHAPGGQQRYSLRVLGLAVSRSESWVKRATVATDEEAVEHMVRTQRNTQDDPELAAMTVLQTMAPARRVGLLMQDEADAIQHAFPELDEAAAGRVLAWARDRFRTTEKENN